LTDHFIEVCYSKDGGHTWSNWRRRSIGAIGEYWQRVVLLRNGRYRHMVARIRVSSPVKRDLLGAVATIEATDG
jgi:hypothetical protein